MEKFTKYLPFIILVYGAYSFWGDYDDHEQKIVQINGQIKSLTATNQKLGQKLKEIEEYSEKIDEYEAQIDQFKSQIQEIKKKIPPEDDKTIILDELSRQAKALNIQEVSFKPKYKREHEDGVYSTNGVEFTGMGTYLQFLLFFEKMSLAERIFSINTVTFKNHPEKRIGKHNIVGINTVIETYHYNEDAGRLKEAEDKKANNKR
ncbi:MAG: type 4a pilus biogenesis protein PilO [Halobacteriovoraceae bacterium]|nr:type 4a pilus biogenesis protein PilO [Halobacteriovoraceae bacterium]